MPRSTPGLALLLAGLTAACGGADAPDARAADSPDAAAGPAPPAPARGSPGMVAGDPEGPVVIEEYADYQCPFCARHYLENQEGIAELLAEGGVRFEVYEVAGPAHPLALDATVAARCAGDQGMYAEARDAVYRNQETWSGSPAGDSVLRALVLPLAADTAALDACLTGQRMTVGRALNQNLRRALAEGTRSTPTTVVRLGESERLLPGVVPVEAIRAAVASVREEQAGAGDAAPSGAAPGPGDAPGGAEPAAGGGGDSAAEPESGS